MHGMRSVCFAMQETGLDFRNRQASGAYSAETSRYACGLDFECKVVVILPSLFRNFKDDDFRRLLYTKLILPEREIFAKSR